jgi:hypothetical protein
MVDRTAYSVTGSSSRVEMRANAELLLERAHDGVRIHLRKGSVLVTAAEAGLVAGIRQVLPEGIQAPRDLFLWRFQRGPEFPYPGFEEWW